jgi:hypothetical protein
MKLVHVAKAAVAVAAAVAASAAAAAAPADTVVTAAAAETVASHAGNLQLLDLVPDRSRRGRSRSRESHGITPARSLLPVIGVDVLVA